MWAYAYERLGYSECSFQSNERQAVVMVAPGGAWVLDALYAIQPPVRQIDDLGRGVNDCAVSGGETFCTVAIGSGDDLVLVQLQADDAESGKRAGEQLVRLLLP
jgi:hypothetical protein